MGGGLHTSTSFILISQFPLFLCADPLRLSSPPSPKLALSDFLPSSDGDGGMDTKLANGKGRRETLTKAPMDGRRIFERWESFFF
jgi:hypothetical protein